MRRRSHVIALSALALLVPAADAAATPAGMTAGPFQVRDYTMTLVATPNSVRGTKATVLLSFERKGGGWLQEHEYTFNKLTLNHSRSLGTGRLRGRLGSFGSVDLKFRANKPARSRGTALRACFGREKSRSGRATGRFSFNPGDTYFQNVTAKRFTARLHDQRTVRCTGALPPRADGHTLEFDRSLGGGASIFGSWHRETDGKTEASFTYERGLVSRILTGPGTLTPAADLMSAEAVGASPFTSGTLRYAAKAPPGAGQGTEGATSGDFSVIFDGQAPIAVPPGTEASLTDHAR